MKKLFPHKILWLASYPKSGNTWFRAFLTALINNGVVDINDMESDGIFSSRDTFDLMAEIESRNLYDTEAKAMLADVYRQLAKDKDHLSVIKVHDAYDKDRNGLPIIPGDVTQCAIYFVRNPLDIIGSLANHMHFGIDEAVQMLTDTTGCMAAQKGNLNNNIQLVQHLSDWGGHVESWTKGPEFPVHVVRYEDMLSDTFTTFSRALEFMGWECTEEQIRGALVSSDFTQLRMQEEQHGFKEKFRGSTRFFRAGVAGGWKNELNEVQVSMITAKYFRLMSDFLYV